MNRGAASARSVLRLSAAHSSRSLVLLQRRTITKEESNRRSWTDNAPPTKEQSNSLHKFILFNIVAFSAAAALYSQSKSGSEVEERRLEDLPFIPTSLKNWW